MIEENTKVNYLEIRQNRSNTPLSGAKNVGVQKTSVVGGGKVKNTGGEPPGTPSLADRLRFWPKIERFAFNNNQNT